PRMPTDPPGIEDVPFINGSVTVRNLGPRFDLRVGYLGITGPELFVLGAGDIDIDPAAPPNRSSQFIYDKPRITNLSARDGKAAQPVTSTAGSRPAATWCSRPSLGAARWRGSGSPSRRPPR